MNFGIRRLLSDFEDQNVAFAFILLFGRYRWIVSTWRNHYRRLRLGGVLVCLWTFIGLTNASGADVAFIARGRVSVSAGKLPEGNRSFEFAYSNGWWQVEVGPGAGLGFNAAKIVDGMRWFVRTEPTPGVYDMAYAEPVTYSPVSYRELFATWLALCPNPELPFVGTNQLAPFALDITPWNAGARKAERPPMRYNATYVAPASVLSTLDIHNSGAWVDDEGTIRAHPFSFRELAYVAASTTNWNGLTLTTAGTLMGFYIHYEKATPPSVAQLWSALVRVQEILPFDATKLRRAPARLVAEDMRIPGAARGEGANYIVTNDVWKPKNDRDLLERGKMLRPSRHDATEEVAPKTPL
jgi:hypothetical protein